MYNPHMVRIVAILSLPLAITLSLAGCRSRDVGKDIRLVEINTGWFDAGIVDGQNKLVPSVSMKIENVSAEDISNVQINAIFRRGEETQIWGEHFVRAIDRSGLPARATSKPIVLRSDRGYTGTDRRATMLQNPQFVDARVQVFGKHGSRTWVKIGEYPIERRLLSTDD